MQLSLSVSLSVPPESATTGVPAADAAPGASGQAAGANSFAAMLPADKEPAGPAVPAAASDAAKSADILATASLMPGAQPGTASLLSRGGDAPAGDNPAAVRPEAFAFSNQSRPAGFFGARSTRTYAAAGSTPVVTEPDASPGAKPGTDLETTSAILAASFVMPGVTLPPVPDPTAPVGPLGILVARSARATVPAASATTGGTLIGSNPATVSLAAAGVPAVGGVATPGENVFPAAAQAVALPKDGAPVVLPAATQPVPVTSRAPAAAPAAGAELTGAILAGMTGQIPPTGQPRSGAAPASAGDRNALTEKNAAGLRTLFPESATIDSADKKDFLSTGQGVVTAASPAVGIGVAEVQSVMPANPFLRSKSAPTVAAVANGPIAVGTAPAQMVVTDAPAPVASLRETMAAVVTAVEALERHADSVQKSVDLQFKVGNEQLALRVELRDGTVHTTFRTDSMELRSALTHEWQAVMPPAAGRELRLADPVFSPAAAGNESALGSPGQGTPQQRGQNNPEPAPFARPADFSAESAPATPAPAVPLTTTLLQAFA